MRVPAEHLGVTAKCRACGTRQVLLTEAVRTVVTLAAEAREDFDHRLRKCLDECGLSFRRPMSVETGAYILFLLDLSLFLSKQDSEARSHVGRVARDRVFPGAPDFLFDIIEARIGQYGRAMSEGGAEDGPMASVNALEQRILSAPDVLSELKVSEAPLRLVDAFQGFQLKALLVAHQASMVSGLGGTVRELCAIVRDIRRVSPDQFDEWAAGREA